MWIPVGKILAGVVFWIIAGFGITEGKQAVKVNIDPAFLDDVIRTREEAFELNPSLKPKRGRPKKS